MLSYERPRTFSSSSVRGFFIGLADIFFLLIL